jgi:acetyl esterase/lipase
MNPGSRETSWGRRLAWPFALAAAVWALLIIVPWPVFGLWKAHLAAQETSLLGACSGALALAVCLWQHGRPRLALALALPATLVNAGLPLAAVPAYRQASASFSPVSYVCGERARAGPPVEVRRDVLLPGATPGQECDLYLPPAPSPGAHPLVVVVHGGSWRGGDKGGATSLSKDLAARGFAVADVRYRLAPAARFPAAVSDVKCMIGLLRARAAELRFDPRRVSLLGRSAGGQIALLAAYSVGDARIPPACPVADEPVSAVAAFYAPTDLAWGHEFPLRPDIVEGPESLELYLGGPPSTHPEAYGLASPQSWTGRPLPRTLLVHGTGDRLVSVEHARRLAGALRAARHPVELLEIPHADHGYDVRVGGVGEQLSRAVLLRFLASN